MTTLDNHLARIDMKLQIWASWYTKIIEAGLGCASIPWDKIVQGRRYNAAPKHLPIPSNETAEKIDAAIVQLWRLIPELGRILHIHYLVPGSIKQHAQCIGLSPAAFKNHVRLAKIWLIAHLSEKEKTRT